MNLHVNHQLYTDTHTTKLYIGTFVFVNYMCLPWQLTPVFLPGEPHGQKSLAGHGVHGVRKSWTQLKWLSMHACIGIKLLNYIWIYKLYACVLFIYMYRQTSEILWIWFQTTTNSTYHNRVKQMFWFPIANQSYAYTVPKVSDSMASKKCVSVVRLLSRVWLWSHEQHTRLPCPSLSAGVCSDSCPLSW